MNVNKINILGACVALLILAVCSLIFIFRMSNQQTIEYWLGIIFLLTTIPLVYLLFTANQLQRPMIYYIQIGTMIGFLIMELLLDYVLKVDFRNIKWITITYVMFFFAGTGGMIGIASQASKVFAIIAILLFLIMTILAFIQGAKTGM